MALKNLKMSKNEKQGSDKTAESKQEKAEVDKSASITSNLKVRKVQLASQILNLQNPKPKKTAESKN